MSTPMCSQVGASPDGGTVSLVVAQPSITPDDPKPTAPIAEGDQIPVEVNPQCAAPIVDLNLALNGFGTVGLNLLANVSVGGALVGQSIEQSSQSWTCLADGSLVVRDFGIRIPDKRPRDLANQPCEIYVQVTDRHGHEAHTTFHAVLYAGPPPYPCNGPGTDDGGPGTDAGDDASAPGSDASAPSDGATSSDGGAPVDAGAGQ